MTWPAPRRALRPIFELRSLIAAEIDHNVLQNPEERGFVRLKLGDSVYGCRDFSATAVAPARRGFQVEMTSAEPGITCVFTTTIDKSELTFGRMDRLPRNVCRGPNCRNCLRRRTLL